MTESGEVRGPVVFGQVHVPTLLIPVGPFFIGWVLAAETLLPTEATFFIALISIFPFLGLGTLLLNDAYDSEVDALSTRKRNYASSTGRVNGGTLKRFAAISFTVSLLLAFVVSLEFLVVITSLVILAVLYSVPPIQLSRKPGMDLAANALGIGVLCTIAGWLVEAPSSLPPTAWLVTSALGTGTFFMLPALMDYGSDAEGGKMSIVVALGWRRACLLGMVLIGLADVGIIYMSLNSIILNPDFLWVAWVIILGEMVVFPVLAIRQDLMKPLTGAMGGLLFVGNFLIVLSYLGMLGPF